MRSYQNTRPKMMGCVLPCASKAHDPAERDVSAVPLLIRFFEGIPALPVPTGAEKRKTPAVATVTSMPLPAAFREGTGSRSAAPIDFFSPPTQVWGFLGILFQINLGRIMQFLIHRILPPVTTGH